MKKLLLLLCVVFFLVDATKAQISDRQNDEATYLLGARPVEGNFGFYFGLSTVDIINLASDSVEWKGIPIVNIKYYYTDKIVLRGGVQIFKKRRSIEGELDYTMQPTFDQNSGFGSGISEYKHNETDARWSFQLGVEQHFALSNIIDGYVGLNGNLGYGRSVRTNNITERTFLSDSTVLIDLLRDEGSSFGVTYGGDMIIGMNIFFADLPLAFGLEYGITFENYGANKYAYEYEKSTENPGGNIDAISSSGTYYTSMVDDFEDAQANLFYDNDDMRFTDLKVKRFDIMPVARVTITYYLNR